MKITDMPLAAKGLISYRYEGLYDWIMIGATDDKDALNEARRSSSVPVVMEKLQIWNGQKYILVINNLTKRNINPLF